MFCCSHLVDIIVCNSQNSLWRLSCCTERKERLVSLNMNSVRASSVFKSVRKIAKSDY